MAVETVVKSNGIWWRKGKKGRKETFRPAVKGKKKKKKKKFPALLLVNAKNRQEKLKTCHCHHFVSPDPARPTLSYPRYTTTDNGILLFLDF
jgi:hypothetical protein